MESSERKFTWFVVAATVAVFFGLAVRNASAGDPVPGIDISLEEIPGGIVTKGITGADGVARFPGLSPGTYRVVLDNVATAVENHNSSRSNKCDGCATAPPTEPGSEGSGSGPSVNIGIGGIFGSGSTKRPQSDRADGRGSSGSAGAGGGVGVGINIPQSSGEVWNQPSKAEVDVGIKEEGVKRAPSGDAGQAMDCNKCKETCTDGRCVQSSGGCFCYRKLPSAEGKAQKEQAEADAASGKRIVGGDYGKETFREVGIKEEGVKRAPGRTDASGGTILWTTLSNGRTASFIPRSACDIKDGMEAALVMVGDEPQFAVRISQTPYLPQGVIIQCGGGDPLKGLNIKGSGGSTGGELCP